MRELPRWKDNITGEYYSHKPHDNATEISKGEILESCLTELKSRLTINNAKDIEVEACVVYGVAIHFTLSGVRCLVRFPEVDAFQNLHPFMNNEVKFIKEHTHDK